MNLLWFYLAVVLAISDILHSHVMWKVLNNFYIILGGLIHEIVHSPLQTWLVHELIEAFFHFIVISIIFLSFNIGIIAASVHLILDIAHTILFKDLQPMQHRALHFVIESFIFIIIFGL